MSMLLETKYSRRQCYENDLIEDRDEAVNDVESLTGIHADLILGKRRFAPVAQARMLVYYLLVKRGHTWSDVGRVMERDHGSVIHGVRQIENWKSIDFKFARRLERLKEKGWDV